jgi:hypothetical protein
MSKVKAIDLIKAFQERIMAGGPLVTFGELESIRNELEIPIKYYKPLFRLDEEFPETSE